MENYLIGKCYHAHNGDVDSLMYIASSLDFGWYYIGRRLVKSTKGSGYFADTDVLDIQRNNLVEIDPIVWDKIHKILKMNTIVCNTIIQNCEEYESHTGYYVSIFPTRTHYKLFEVLKDSQILTKFNNTQVWVRELKEDAVKFETVFSTGKKWISSEVYYKVKNNVMDTIKKIDDIWKTISQVSVSN